MIKSNLINIEIYTHTHKHTILIIRVHDAYRIYCCLHYAEREDAMLYLKSLSGNRAYIDTPLVLYVILDIYIYIYIYCYCYCYFGGVFSSHPET